MNYFKRSAMAVLITFSAIFSLTGCATSSHTGAEVLQALADAGQPCDFPVNIVVAGGSGFTCMDELNGERGYTLQFFESNADLKSVLKGACQAPVGPGIRDSAQDASILTGENWFATADEGSKYSLADLKAILGGSEAKLADLCG